MYFQMKRSAPLHKLMNAYRLEATSMVFMHGGRKINAENTADEVKLSSHNTASLLHLRVYIIFIFGNYWKYKN